jgi:hypothetical protein
VIDAAPTAAVPARARAEELLSARRARREHGGRHAPRTIDGALRRMPDADLALISVPGAWAAAEARRALARGLHVMIWSDNVSIEDEVALKQLAARSGLLVMGPDCGTAVSRRHPRSALPISSRAGRVGMVAASGTGLQQVAALLAAQGEGISQAIGVGGRDMSLAVGGLMTLAALDALGADAATEVIAVIGKPGAPAVRRASRRSSAPSASPPSSPSWARTSGPVPSTASPRWRPSKTPAAPSSRARAGRRARSRSRPKRCGGASRRRAGGLRAGGTAIRGLYAGGTLAHEAALILEPWLGPIDTNMSPRPQPRALAEPAPDRRPRSGRAHRLTRPSHARSTLRLQAIAAAARDDDVGVLLLDVVLGLGAAADPAGDLAPALEAARGRGRAARHRPERDRHRRRIPRGWPVRSPGSSGPAPGCCRPMPRPRAPPRASPGPTA